VIEYLNLSINATKSVRILKTENFIEVPADGKITEFIIWFPSGTDNLVAVECGVGPRHLVPANGDVRLSETVVYFKVDTNVNAGDRIWAQITNYSDSKDFYIGVFAGFERKEVCK
jgi:hypothetical protein